ncbi:MAG: cell division protein FtsL [Rhabdaerophilum sp.]
MIRLFNLLALVAVIASATWAYSVKYETILVAEKLRKREAELQRERDATAMLQAEWHLLNRPARMQALKKPESALQSVSARQIVRPGDIPERPPEAPDALDSLLTGSIPSATPDPQRKTARAGGNTPGATPRPAANGATPLPATPVRSRATITTVPAPKAATRPVAQAAPVRIIPPARVGPTPAARDGPPAPVAPAPREGGLTGFLKRLVP